MPPDVRSLCVCPRCRGRLEWRDAEIACTGCAATYRLAGQTPVLLPPERAAPAQDDRWYAGARGVLPGALTDALDPYRALVRPSLTFKSRAGARRVERFVAELGAEATVLNVGAGETDYGPNVVNVELEPGPRVDVVGVAEQLPFPDACCAGVVLMAVLEHVGDADRALAEAARVLAPAGRALVDVPFVQGYHASPADYRRYTEQGLRGELERHGFAVEGSGVAVGPASGAAWILSEFLALLVSGRSAKAYRLARLATTWLALPLKYADAWLERHPMAYVIPSAVWAIGRKP